MTQFEGKSLNMQSLRPFRRLCTATNAAAAAATAVVSTHIPKAGPFDDPALIKLKKERDPDKLFELFKANAHNRLVVENRFAFEDTVSKLAGARRFDYIENLLEHQKALPQGRREGFVVRIIILYGKAGMTRHAVETFHNMHLFGCSRTVKSFNAAIKVLSQTRDLEAVHSFINEVPAKYGIAPDIFSLNIVVKAFCEMGFLDSAYMVMIELEKVGIIPDVITYTTLISFFYEKNRCEIGNGLWNLMILRKCFPNLTTFNVRIQYLVKRRRAWQANSLMGMMRFIRINPDEVTYNLVIKGFFQAGYIDMAKRVFSALHGEGNKPNCKVYQTMIHYLCKSGEFDLAYTFCKDSMSNNWFPSADTICKLLEGLLRNSKHGQAKAIMKMVKRRIPPFPVKELKIFECILSQSPKVE